MKLNPKQIFFYKKNGFLKIEKYLDHKEVEILKSEISNTIEENSPRIIREDNGSVRSVFAPHFVSEIYKKLSRLERLVKPSIELIGNNIYLHQYKINTKKGLKSEWWEWHQDFPYWHLDDGIEAPDLISVMIYLQDTDSSNGALMLVPKSHKLGIVDFAKKVNPSDNRNMAYSDNLKSNDFSSSLNSNIKFTVDHNILSDLVTKNRIITASGKKGTVIFFHGNLFHASNINLTPFDRDAIIITYNSVDNLPRNTQNPRPSFLAGNDYHPIKDLESNLY